MGTLENKIGMPLYDVPNGSKVRVLSDIKIPPASPEIKEEDILTFNRLDGMYSHCTNSKGETCHLAGWAQVEIIKNEE
jgi:hypothetical protein